jgi:hypothetical protein
LNNRVFIVDLAHKKYGENWARATVAARSAMEAIKKAVKLKSNKNTYAMEVKLVATLDRV